MYWVVLLEQWPMRMSLIIHALEKDKKVGAGQFSATMQLHEVYDQLKWFVHNFHNNLHVEEVSLRRRHQRLISLDQDNANFENLLHESVRLVGCLVVWMRIYFICLDFFKSLIIAVRLDL